MTNRIIGCEKGRSLNTLTSDDILTSGFTRLWRFSQAGGCFNLHFIYSVLERLSYLFATLFPLALRILIKALSMILGTGMVIGFVKFLVHIPDSCVCVLAGENCGRFRSVLPSAFNVVRSTE